MLEFLSLKPKAFGLDISDLSLKIIKLKKKRGNFSLVSLGETPIKSGVIRGGEVKKESDLVKIIKKAISEVKGEKINTKYVIASLPEEKAFLQVIQMPKIPEENLKSAVVYEAENYIPLSIEEVYLDSQIIPSAYNQLAERSEGWEMNEVHRSDHFDVLIAALPRKTVNSYLNSLEKAGLTPLALEIESQAMARALIKNEITTSPVLIIDFGATRTSFIIFSGHSLRFTSSIFVSSQKLTEAISQILKVDLIKAEKLKLNYGLETRGTLEGGEIFEALLPSITELIEQIKKHLSYYQSHTAHEHLPPDSKGVGKILLCGGGSNLKGLPNFLSRELKIPVELGNPWINILPETKKEVPGLLFEKSLSYTTAIGLALRGVRENTQ